MSLRKKLFIYPSVSKGLRRGFILFALVLSCLILPLSVSALEIKNPLKYDTFEKLIEAIIDFIYEIALVLATLFIVIAGFYFVTSSGDPAKIKTGQDIIKYTLIGLLIILLSKGLIAVIQTVLGVQ
jgi:hypothetical protein